MLHLISDIMNLNNYLDSRHKMMIHYLVENYRVYPLQVLYTI